MTTPCDRNAISWGTRLPRDPAMRTGLMLFIAGIFFCTAGVAVITFFQLSLVAPDAIHAPLLGTALGVLFVLLGTHRLLHPDGDLFRVLPYGIVPAIALMLIEAGYPASWTDPLIRYLAVFYFFGCIMLTGMILSSFAAAGRRERSCRTDLFAICEEPVPLRYWNSRTPDDVNRTLQSETVELICQIQKLGEACGQERRTAQADARSILLGLVGVADYLEKFFRSIKGKETDVDRQTKIWLGNIRTCQRLVTSALADAGVAPVGAVEGKAVLGWHTIEGTEPRPGVEDYVILEELEKGYVWKGAPLRKSRVIVVKNGGSGND